jgi:hypothetical protein
VATDLRLDAAAVAEFHAGWADLLELQITPVIEDSEAGSRIAKGPEVGL